MRDQEWLRTRRDELWEALVPGSALPGTQDRATSAISQVRAIRQVTERFRAAGNDDPVATGAHMAQAILSLVAAEELTWAVDFPGLPNLHAEKEWEGNSRLALLAICEASQLGISPLHREAVDPVTLMMPRWLFERMRNGLSALNEGEVHEIFAPAPSGRHEPWTWDQMRARAIEHVAFLHGQGVALKIARARVGTALKVAPDTLRQWEREIDLKGNLQIARDAGALKSALDDDPDHRDGAVVDASALALLEQVTREPLGSFGQLYRARFGTRHNQ